MDQKPQFAKTVTGSTRKTLAPGKYRHFKGKVYVVLGVALHTEGDYKMAVYHPEGKPSELYARPVEMFSEHVIIDGRQMPRFEPL